MNDRFIKATRYMCGKTVDVYFAGNSSAATAV